MLSDSWNGSHWPRLSKLAYQFENSHPTTGLSGRSPMDPLFAATNSKFLRLLLLPAQATHPGLANKRRTPHRFPAFVHTIPD
jgi:hypothetical protein